MRRLLIAIALAPGLAAPNAAQAQQFFFDTADITIPHLISYSTATSSSGCTVGVHGCIASTSFASPSSGISIAGPDADLAQMPYGARVRVDFFDNASNGTLTCTSQTLTGYDMAGNKVQESMGTVTETGDTSANVYRQVISYVASGCSGGAASDIIRLNVNEEEIGVPLQLMADSDVLSIALAARDNSTPWHTITSGWTRVGNGYAVALGSVVQAGDDQALTSEPKVMLQVKGRRFLKFAGGKQ